MKVRVDMIRTNLLQRLSWGLLLAMLWLLEGCATSPAAATSADSLPIQALRAQREAHLQSSWQGQPYQALLNTYGRPAWTLRVPGERPLPNFVVVYEKLDQPSPCIDAFTLVQPPQTQQWTVADYFCR